MILSGQNTPMHHWQQEHEHLTDYVKRFKQTKDVVKAHMGSKWLEQFVEHTEEYQKETDTKQQSELKIKALRDIWHLYY